MRQCLTFFTFLFLPMSPESRNVHVSSVLTYIVTGSHLRMLLPVHADSGEEGSAPDETGVPFHNHGSLLSPPSPAPSCALL